MKIPSQCRMGGHTIKIGRDPKMSERRKLGEAYADLLEIFVAGGRPESSQQETYVHELIEVADALCQLELEHHKIQTLAVMLHQALTTGEGDIDG